MKLELTSPSKPVKAWMDDMAADSAPTQACIMETLITIVQMY